VAVKDQAETKGIETRFGSVALSGYVPEKDATIVTKMKAPVRSFWARRDAGFCDNRGSAIPRER